MSIYNKKGEDMDVSRVPSTLVPNGDNTELYILFYNRDIEITQYDRFVDGKVKKNSVLIANSAVPALIAALTKGREEADVLLKT